MDIEGDFQADRDTNIATNQVINNYTRATPQQGQRQLNDYLTMLETLAENAPGSLSTSINVLSMDTQPLDLVRLTVTRALMDWKLPPDSRQHLLSDITRQSLVSTALHPLITMESFTDEVADALEILTSRQVRHLVTTLRATHRAAQFKQKDQAYDFAFMDLARAVLEPQYGEGLKRLFADLTDPLRGAPALALAYKAFLNEASASGVTPQTPDFLQLAAAGLTGALIGGVIGGTILFHVAKAGAAGLLKYLLGSRGAPAILGAIAIALATSSVVGVSLWINVSRASSPTPVVVAATVTNIVTSTARTTSTRTPSASASTTKIPTNAPTPKPSDTPTLLLSTNTPILVPTDINALLPTQPVRLSPTLTFTSPLLSDTSLPPTTEPVPSPSNTSLPPTAEPTPPVITPPTNPVILNEAYEWEVIERINQERAEHDCDVPLTYASALGRAARRHAVDMATHDFVGHTGSDGSEVQQRIEAEGYLWAYGNDKTPGYAENAGGGLGTPADIVARWLSSAYGHGETLLNCGFREIGVGYAYNDSTQHKHHWAAVFTIGRR